MNAVLRELGPDQCRRLIENGGVGRVAFQAPFGQQIIPVSYQLHGDSIVFRTTPYSELGCHGPGSEAAFEVERLDVEHRTGWSVVARGPLRVVLVQAEVAAIELGGDPQPWAAGTRRLYLRLRWRELTGRRLGIASSVESSRVVGGRQIWLGYSAFGGMVHGAGRGGQPPRY